MLKKKYIFFDFAGTLVGMRPAVLLIKKDLLFKLSENYSLGIITGAKRSETFNILSKTKILNLFKVVVTADDSDYKKPNPKLFPNLAIFCYIGDKPKDALFAKQANITFFRVNKKYNINQIVKELL